MKAILTGTTGFIGTGVLQILIADPAVTSIIVLSRRDLPMSHQHPKVRTIIHKDFTSYPPSVLEELVSAETVIWSMGIKLTQMGSLEEARTVEVTSPLALARVVAEKIAPALPEGKKTRFVYVSGVLGERDQEKGLWFATDARRMKGEVENELEKLDVEIDAKEGSGKGRFESYVVRPAMVTADTKDEGLAMSLLIGSKLVYTSAIRRDELAGVMVELGTRGSEERGGKRTWDNCDMVTLGREIIERKTAT